MTVETIELAPGYRISRMLRGGWQLAGGHGAIEAERAIADMAAFVDASAPASRPSIAPTSTPASKR